jgi:ADP-ribose pyrophosphatase YjhB (NUDIX family)
MGLVPKLSFCSSCGNVLTYKRVEQKERAVCPNCGQIFYEHLKVGAGAVIEQEGCLLLLQRTQAPFKHQWNLPAGYVEVDESPAQAVIREVHEETGLEVDIERLVNVHFFDDDPRGNGILILYACRITGGTLAESLEGKHPAFFDVSQIPTALAGGGHAQAIRAWQTVKVT